MAFDHKKSNLHLDIIGTESLRYKLLSAHIKRLKWMWIMIYKFENNALGPMDYLDLKFTLKISNLSIFLPNWSICRHSRPDTAM